MKTTFNPASSPFLRRKNHTGEASWGWLVVLGVIVYTLAQPGGTVGGQIVYVANDPEGGDFDIYTMKANGSSIIALTEQGDDSEEFEPEWSPDGERIVFISDRDGADTDIFIMDADGSHLEQLTINDDYDDGGPVFSPVCHDSNIGCRDWIAFHSDRGEEGDYDIFIMDSGGQDVTRIVDLPGDQLWPAWSPDGQKVMFMSGDLFDLGTFDLYAIDLGNGSIDRYTDSPGVADLWPVWSPDGAHIAWVNDEGDGWFHVYIMEAQCDPDCGANPTMITSDEPVHDLDPNWSPDSKWIVFSSHRAPSSEEGARADFEIFVIRIDGSQLMQLTVNEFIDDYTPAWTP